MALAKAAFLEADFPANIHVVRNGEEAISYLHRHPPYEAVVHPDLILLDLNLPGKSGFDVLDAVKGNPELRRIPIVILTTSSAKEDIEKTYDMHANSFTTKPSGIERFIDFVQSLESFWVQNAHLPPKRHG